MKEIENYFCEDITANNKYNLVSISILYNEKQIKTRRNTNNSINTKNKFVITTSI